MDEAAGRLLSALSNSAEVVQRFGFNIRSAALESAFKDLGINKTVEQASEAEKLIARVLILLETSSVAQLNIFGDFDRTINEFANQTRGLQSSITIFLRSIGNTTNAFLRIAQAAVSVGTIQGPQKFFGSMVSVGQGTVAAMQGQYRAFRKIKGLLSAPTNIGPANTVAAFSTPIKGLLNGPLESAKAINEFLRSIRKRTGSAVKGLLDAPQAGADVIRKYVDALRAARTATKNLPAVSTGAGLIPRKVVSGVVESASGLSRAFAQPINVAFTVIKGRVAGFIEFARSGFAKLGFQAKALILSPVQSTQSVFRSFAQSSSAASSFVANSIRSSFLRAFDVIRGGITVLAASMVATAAAVRSSVVASVLAVGASLRSAATAAVLFGRALLLTALFPFTHTRLFIQLMTFGLVQALQGVMAALLVLRGALARTALGFIGMARTAVVSFLTIAATGAKVVVTHIFLAGNRRFTANVYAFQSRRAGSLQPRGEPAVFRPKGQRCEGFDSLRTSE